MTRRNRTFCWGRANLALPFESVRPTKYALSLGKGPPPFNNPLLFVIPKRSRISYLTALTSAAYVVLLKENHMPSFEAAILDRKSGEAEGSAVRHSGAPNFPFYNHFPFVILKDETATARPVAVINFVVKFCCPDGTDTLNSRTSQVRQLRLTTKPEK